LCVSKPLADGALRTRSIARGNGVCSTFCRDLRPLLVCPEMLTHAEPAAGNSGREASCDPPTASARGAAPRFRSVAFSGYLRSRNHTALILTNCYSLSSCKLNKAVRRQNSDFSRGARRHSALRQGHLNRVDLRRPAHGGRKFGVACRRCEFPSGRGSPAPHASRGARAR